MVVAFEYILQETGFECWFGGARSTFSTGMASARAVFQESPIACHTAISVLGRKFQESREWGSRGVFMGFEVAQGKEGFKGAVWDVLMTVFCKMIREIFWGNGMIAIDADEDLM